MTQPITSKLAQVAQCMNEFVRRENEAYTLALSIASATSDLRLVQLEAARDLTAHLYARIRELEDDLRESEEALRVSHELCNTLEISILECEHHRQAAAIHRERIRRALPMELVDLTTDSDSE